MSGQKTRKVRMGSSRNYARDRNDKPLTDDADCDASHDSKSCIIFSEQTNVTCLNPSENKSVPISEVKESKRKLGSTQRNRGRLEGNESTAMTKHESGEEVDGDSSRRDAVMTYFTSRPIAQDTMETKRDSSQSQKSVKLPLSSNVESEIMLPITQESLGDETNISDESLSAQCDKEMTIETLSQNTSQIPSERCELLEKCDPDAGDKVIKEGKVTSEPIQMASTMKIPTPAAQENNNLQVGSENHIKLTKNKDISSSTVAGVSFESGDTAMMNSLEAGSKSSMLQCKADTMNDNETASDRTQKSIFCKSNEINLKDSLQLNALSCEIGLEVGNVNPSVDMKISNTHISDGLLSLTSCDEMLYTSEQNSSVCLKSPEKHVNQNEYTISEKTKKKRKFGSTRKDLRNNDGIKNAMDGQDIDATVPTAFQGDENEVSVLITGPHDSSVQHKDKELEETNENTDIVESQDYEFKEVDRSSLMQVSSSKECLDFKEEIQEVLHQGDKEHSSIAQSPKQNIGPMDIDDTTDKSVCYVKKITEEKHLEQEVDIESDKIDAIISKDFEAFDEGMSPILETASIFDSIKDNSSICVTPQENYASQKEITNLEKKEKKRKFGSKRKNPRNDSELKYKVEEKDNDTTLPTDFDKDPNNFTKVILFCKENSELTASTHPVCVEHSVKFESKSSGLYDGHETEIQISDDMHRQSYKMNEGAYKNTSETSETILNTGDNHSQEYCESASDRSGKDMDQNNEFLTGELMATASGQVSHITIVQEASNVTGMLDINVSESQTDNLIPDKTMRRRRKMGSTRRIHKVQAEIEHIIERWETGSGLSEMDSDDAGLMALDSDSDRKQKVSNSNVEVVDEKEVEESSQIISHTFTTMDHHECLDIEHQFAKQTSPAESNPFYKVDANSEYQSPGRRRKMGSTRKVLANRVKQGIQKDHSSDGADGSHIKDAQVVDSTSGHKGVIAPLSTDAPAHREYSPFDFQGGTVLPEQVNHMQEQDPRSHIQFQEQIDADLTNIENRPPLDPLKCGPAGGSRGLVPGSNYYNVVMVGNSNVGKTSCIKRVQSGMFSPDLCASIGIDTCMHSIMVDKKLVTLQLWDTAGQERYHSITKQVFHKAHAFLLMYDITSYQSFSDIRYWAACLKEGASDDLIVMLLGNKNECTKRQVNTADGASLAKEYDFMFMECSVATGANVTLSMETLARVLHQNMQNTQRGTLVLDTKTPQNKLFGCC